MLDIIRLYDSETKKAVARGILEALPEWFGIAEAREEYIAQSAAEPFWSAYDGDKPIGFLYIHQTSDATLELYAMGICARKRLLLYSSKNGTNGQIRGLR